MVEAWLLKKLCKHWRVYLSMEGRGLKSEVHVSECAHSYLGKRSKGANRRWEMDWARSWTELCGP